LDLPGWGMREKDTATIDLTLPLDEILADLTIQLGTKSGEHRIVQI